MMLRVINGGIETLVEDWPGRIGYLGKGMAASGAMDNVALEFANLLVGNIPGEAGLEIAGGYFEAEFGEDTVISVTGTDMQPLLNCEPFPCWQAVRISPSRISRLPSFLATWRASLIRCRQYVHFSMTPRERTVTSGF